jgi:hypothetical protein
MLKKIYDIEYINKWPYEKDVGVRVANDDDPIVLDDDDSDDRMHRAYLRLPDRHVSWAIIEGLPRYDHAPDAVDPRFGEIWVQIEYTIFTSRRRGDDTRLERLRRTLRKGGLDAIPFPPGLRPDQLHLDGYTDAFHTLRLEGELTRQPFNVLYVSRLSDIPPINHHTIPEDRDFAWVDVQVVTYGRYDAIPTYRELPNRLDHYCGCFDGLIDENLSRSPADLDAVKSTEAARQLIKRKRRGG